MVDEKLYEYLCKYVQYSPEDGQLRWKEKPPHVCVEVGSILGSFDKDGYRRTGVMKKAYRNSRLVWFMHHKEWPKNYVDHINGVKTDDRIENLREATPQENAMNRPKQSTNSTGYKGVTFHKRDKKYQATIEMSGKVKFLGYFNSALEAHQAYCKKAEELFGEFANFGEFNEVI
jgi:hypothetical protein